MPAPARVLSAGVFVTVAGLLLVLGSLATLAWAWGLAF